MKATKSCRFALVLAGLSLFSLNVSAQPSRDRTDTERRGYGDIMPELGHPTAYSPITIIEAAKSGGIAEARAAFLRGESINSRDNHGASALLIAAKADNISVLRFLLENDANPNMTEKSTGRTPLMAACDLGNGNMVRLLLERKADANHKDRQGESPLMKAARIGAADVVKILIAAGADVNLTDYAGHTALWHAQDARHAPIARLIADSGGV